MKTLALRDLSLLGLTVVLWALATSVFALPVAIGAALCAFQFHEWGHYLGGLRVNAQMEPARVWWSPFLFRFEVAANTRQQFLQMSWPGFAATALFLGVFFLLLPDAHPATALTRTLGAALAALTVIIEVPIALWTLAGGKTPPVPVWLPGSGGQGER